MRSVPVLAELPRGCREEVLLEPTLCATPAGLLKPTSMQVETAIAQDPSRNPNHCKLGFFDDGYNWSDDQVVVLENAGAVKSSISMNTHVEKVSPLVRAIFDGPQSNISDGNRGASSKYQAGAVAASLQSKHRAKSHDDEVGYEEMLGNKVRALEEEIENFKKENKRLKKLAKETEVRLERLAHEKAEWEQQKVTQLQLFHVQQEEQIDKMKKERQILEVRSQAMLVLPTVQRKEVEELRSSLSRQQDEHRGKEKRWLSTVSRVRLMNENLTQQVLELQEEIKQYESCVLARHCGGDSGKDARATSINSSVDPHHKHAISELQLKDDIQETGEILGRHEHNLENCEATTIDTRSKSEPGLLIEQAKLLSKLYRHPRKESDCTMLCMGIYKTLPQGKYTNLRHGQSCPRHRGRYLKLEA